MEDQMIYCVGNLVGSWANCESMFYGIFYCMTASGDNNMPAVLWLSTKSTQARLDMILNIARSLPLLDGMLDDLVERSNAFQGITRTRNLYCHAYYTVSPTTQKIVAVQTVALTPPKPDGSILTLNTKPVSKSTINELVDTIRRASDLNLQLWKTLLRFQAHFQAQHLKLPEPLPEWIRPKSTRRRAKT